MRVALFAAGGEIPACALRVLHERAQVVAIIRPRRPRTIRSVLRRAVRRVTNDPRRSDSLTRLAVELDVPEWTMSDARDARVIARLRGARLDLACIATFPWTLPEAAISAARLGTVNIHASLLPRHRGANPWFWTYHADDREAGVTVHLAESRADRGAILAQSRWPLPRAHPVATLHAEVAAAGAALLPDVLARVAGPESDLRALARTQDEPRATRAPRVAAGTPMLDGSWPAERTWHFLSGLAGQWREPLRSEGRPLHYGRVPSFELGAPPRAAGTIERDLAGGWRLWCRDGFVRLAPVDG